MNQQPTQFNRFRVMSALALAVLGVYLVVLFNIQVVHHDDYLAQSSGLSRSSNLPPIPIHLSRLASWAFFTRWSIRYSSPRSR